MTRRRDLASGAVLFAAFAVLFGRVAIDLGRAWATDSNYSHGLLAVPLAGYIGWRRIRNGAVPGRPRWSGAAIAALGAGLCLAGTLTLEPTINRLAMLLSLAGSIVFLWGWPHLRVLARPFVLLLLAIPIPALLFNEIALPLQLLASRFGESLLSLASVPVLRDGNVLTLATATLEVADACSGIRSLMSLVFVSVVLTDMTGHRPGASAAIAVASIPIAVVANGLRVAGTGLAVSRFGPVAAEGVPHALSGWLAFVAACGALWFAAGMLARVTGGRRAAELPC